MWITSGLPWGASGMLRGGPAGATNTGVGTGIVGCGVSSVYLLREFEYRGKR